MKDPWCAKLSRNGKTLSGGAARNVRIAESGGMNDIIASSVGFALQEANRLADDSPSDTSNVVPFRQAS